MNIYESKTETAPRAHASIWKRYNHDLNQRLKGLIETSWTDHPANPVVNPFAMDLIADPTVITPSLSPDGLWHMVACGGGKAMIQLSSHDGVKWERYAEHKWSGFSPCVYPFNDRFYLFYQMNNFPDRCWIVMRESHDLKVWSEAKTILEPNLSWENVEFRPTCRNACIVQPPEGGFRLYYSGGVKRIPDLGFEEPANIGIAHSESIDGPYEKHPTPILVPDINDPFRNIGAGAMKVFYLKAHNLYVGFNNGIYSEIPSGHSRSAIHILLSEDGMDWYDVPGNPILSPEPDGWKSALVYQLCLAAHEGQWHLYYNSREGWEVGVERIGLATAPLNGIDPSGVNS